MYLAIWKATERQLFVAHGAYKLSIASFAYRRNFIESMYIQGVLIFFTCVAPGTSCIKISSLISSVIYLAMWKATERQLFVAHTAMKHISFRATCSA